MGISRVKSWKLHWKNFCYVRASTIHGIAHICIGCLLDHDVIYLRKRFPFHKQWNGLDINYAYHGIVQRNYIQ